LSPQPTVVLKFGGSSVADVDKLGAVADIIARRRADGSRVCVVVSAMGKATDGLLALAKQVTPSPSRRELDMLLSTGERSSAALLAMALCGRGVDAISFTGSQAGIITNAAHAGARILEVRPYRVQDELDAGRVVVLAGFQGVSYSKEVTTLGRGGSDTTAVALAAALDANCEIYSDVDGVWTSDPRVVPSATRIDALSHEEMQELAAAGAKVLNAQAVEFAKAKGIAVYARKTGDNGTGTVVRKDAPAAVGGVRGVAHRDTLYRLRVPFASLGQLLERLRALHIPAGPTEGGVCGDATVLVFPEDAHGIEAIGDVVNDGVTKDVVTKDVVGAVSLVGQGMFDAPGLLADVLAACAQAEAEVLGVSTSSFRITVVVAPGEGVARLARHLHAQFVRDERLEAA